MRFLLLNHLQNAQQSIKANRMRSFLTVLGIAIGVASITTILALSAGANSIIRTQVDALGGNIAVIRPGTTPTSIEEEFATVASAQFATSSLTEYDLRTVQDISGVKSVAPLSIIHSSVQSKDRGTVSAPVVATSPTLETISNLSIAEGQFLDEDLSHPTAVIGPQLSIELFGTEQAIGKSVSIRGTAFTVIGVLKRENNPINYNNVDFDKAVLVTTANGKLLTQTTAPIQQINIQSDSVATLSGVITEVNKKLLTNHYNQADFSVLSGEQIAQPTSRIFTAIAGVSVAIAAISLLVGGVGIMNIMLVNVAERTREIGIRKALGATNTDIVVQFIIESLLLSLIGGVIGYITGYAFAFAISTFLTFDAVFTWNIVGVATALSVLTGLIFGIYPAARAARKDPITALRQYN